MKTIFHVHWQIVHLLNTHGMLFLVHYSLLRFVFIKCYFFLIWRWHHSIKFYLLFPCCILHHFQMIYKIRTVSLTLDWIVEFYFFDWSWGNELHILDLWNKLIWQEVLLLCWTKRIENLIFCLFEFGLSFDWFFRSIAAMRYQRWASESLHLSWNSKSFIG